MPRAPNIIKPTLLHVSLPEDIRTKLDLALWSELENRVPKGGYQRFFIERIQEYFTWTRLDLTAFGYPPGFFVTGPREMIERLKSNLERTPQ